MTSLSQKPHFPEPQSIRTRSLDGCSTCRKRHVKCDEGRPTCSMCRYFELECGGYEKNIFFDFEDSPEDGTVRFRRPLFTEQEREHMSKWLTSSVPPRAALRILSQIDDECEDATSLQEFEIYRGPFGAFRLSQPQSTSPTFDLFSEETDETSPAQDLIQLSDDLVFSTEAALSPWTQAIVQSIFNESEQIPLSPTLDFLNMRDSGRIQEVFENMSVPEMEPFSMPLPTTHSYPLAQFPPNTQFQQSMAPNSINQISSLNNVPPDTLLLLEHYSKTVISSLTPFRHTKTPWHVLFLPLAKSCLAALMLGERLDHARLAMFFGTLSISAFSLGGISQSQIWTERGQTYKKQAREHVRLILKSAYILPKVAKYKDILMALITMVQLTMLSRSRDQTEYYLLETEKLIRLRGLNRHKSRKVRLLHHCYAFARVLHESTFQNVLNSDQRRDVRQAVESSGLIIYGQDEPTFRVIGWKNLDQEMMLVKDMPDGENDLHLERPGIFPHTMYPEIFGVPEPWIFLLSQVIRLGNEKEDAEQQSVMNPLSLRDFANRAKAIERCIKQLHRPSKTTNVEPTSQQERNQQVFDNMLDSMQYALEIYFYRRIYNVPASMLQQKIASVSDSLQRCEQADPNVAYGSAGIMWAAFIAACEAEDPDVQSSFSSWFTRSAQRSGLPSSTNQLETIEQVWQERRDGSDSTLTWRDLAQANGLLQQHL